MGVERTALAIIFELEELLLVVVFAGAKWVSCPCAGAGIAALAILAL